MEVYGYIYLITNKINGKQYIGQTSVSLKERLRGYKKSIRNLKNSTAITNAMRKYGIENFDMVSIAACFDQDGLNEIEILLIASYNTLAPYGYNLEVGGRGRKHHPDTIRKISIANRNPSMEIRKKLSIAQTGKVYSKESKEKMSISHIGKVCSEEQKLKMRLARLGKKMSPESIAKTSEAKFKAVIDQNGTVYPSLKAAAEAIGCSPSSVCCVLSGRMKSIRGIVFRYVDSGVSDG